MKLFVRTPSFQRHPASWFGALILCLVCMTSAHAAGVQVQDNVEYAVHDGISLTGTIYSPAGSSRSPAIVAIHGGGWQVGDRSVYKHWGPYLAERGYTVFAIEYRLGKDTYPELVQDVLAAIKYIRGNSDELNVDPDRLALIGDSSGGHLAALAALAGKEEPFRGAYPADAHSGVDTAVKAVVTIYGVFDMAAQWNHDQLARPLDQISQNYLGVAPMESRRVYFEASPISYAEQSRRGTAFLVVYGTQDDVVDPETQSIPFINALKQARIPAQPLVVEGAPHFWIWDPIDEPQSFTHFLAPRLLWFLQSRL
ncbi:alpha/beta hydrolase [Antarcticirhabdus aurantiaca]|uniref:alpha/beta hydrolase n=1 Tax=Antarcticirhabdus aurantiaca TaxID=2606717 RepID=UPI00131E267D|nr:alpha/beta hydrolase [Antarcticirhabdus aurantiaca]